MSVWINLRNIKEDRVETKLSGFGGEVISTYLTNCRSITFVYYYVRAG